MEPVSVVPLAFPREAPRSNFTRSICKYVRAIWFPCFFHILFAPNNRMDRINRTSPFETRRKLCFVRNAQIFAVRNALAVVLYWISVLRYVLVVFLLFQSNFSFCVRRRPNKRNSTVSEKPFFHLAQHFGEKRKLAPAQITLQRIVSECYLAE